MSNFKLCKDYDIDDTLKKIKQILLDLDIHLVEEILEPVQGIYSVSLVMIGTNARTNGKGISKENALVSAYAEMMERIQNFALYKLTYPVNDLVHSDFLYYPDEKFVSINEIDTYTELFGDSLKVKVNDVLELHSKYEQKSNSIATIPYKDYVKNQEVYVPAKLQELIYTTNGMAAGNTLEEALVQAISEVFERFANKLICYGQMIPPRIPDESLSITEETAYVLKEIGNNTNYSLEFRDCSLGLGLPVIGLYFINKETGKYFVKFGAHPVMSVAIERTITELFQGRKIALTEFWLKRFSFDDIENMERNFEKIFRSGDGVYPSHIFSKKNTYDFNDIWYKDTFESNYKLLSYIVDIIIKNKWTLLYKNVGFLGMPSVHVIVPEISSITCLDERYVKQLSSYHRIKNLARKINQCTNSEILEILIFIEQSYYSPLDYIAPLYGLPVNSKSLLRNCNVEYYKYMLYFVRTENEQALNALDKFIEANGFKNSRKGCYYRCLRELLNGVYVKGQDREETEVILREFYGIENVTNASYELNHMKDKLKDLSYDCYDCSNCNNKECCSYKNLMDLHLRIAKRCSDVMGVNREIACVK